MLNMKVTPTSYQTQCRSWNVSITCPKCGKIMYRTAFYEDLWASNYPKVCERCGLGFINLTYLFSIKQEHGHIKARWHRKKA